MYYTTWSSSLTCSFDKVDLTFLLCLEREWKWHILDLIWTDFEQNPISDQSEEKNLVKIDKSSNST